MKKQLTELEEQVMFGGGTEAPFSGTLLNEKRSGDFVCKNCGESLFSSYTKFDSGTGWPSFAEPANRQNIKLLEDNSYGMRRIEVRCANCDAHLGHVFDDGPQNRGGQRYCINSTCLVFKEAQ